MPSGAKKRKAAKKRKEKGANYDNPSSIDGNHHQVVGDDERDSDGGSSLSGEHNDHQHPFDESNEVSEKSDLSPIASDVTDSQPADQAGRHIAVIEGDGLIEIEKEVNSEQDATVKHVFVVGDDGLIEIDKEVNSEQDAGSVSIEHVTRHDEVDSSVGVDESLASENKWKEDAYNTVSNRASSGNKEKTVDSFAEDVTKVLEIEKPHKDGNSDLDGESVPKVDLASPDVPMSEVVNCVMESAQVENVQILEVVESGLSQNEELLHESNKVNGILPTAVGPETKEEKVFPIVDVNIETSNDAVMTTVIADESKISVESDAHAPDSIKNVGNTEAFETTDVAAGGNQCTLLKLSGAYIAETGIDAETTKETTDAEILEVVESGLSQNEELLRESNKVNGIFPTAVGLEKNEEMVFPIVDVNIETSNDAVINTVIADESKILAESDAHAPDSIKNVGNTEAFETTDVAAGGNQCTLLKLSGAYTAETEIDTETTDAEILEVVELGVSQNEELLHESNKVNGILPTAVGPEKKEEKVFPIVDANIETSNDAVMTTVIADESKILAESDAHAPDSIKNVGNTEAFENTDVAADGNQCTLLKLSGAYTAETGIDAETTDAEILEVVESRLSQNEEMLHESNNVNGILPAAVGPEKNEEKVFPIVDMNIETSNDAVMTTVIADESKILVESDAHTLDSIKNVGTTEAFETTDVAVDGNHCTLLKLSGAYTVETGIDAETTKETTDAEILEVVESRLSQNEEMLHESNNINGILPTAVGPEKKEEKVFPIVDVNIETSNDAVMTTVIADESKILAESDAHAPDSTKNVGNTETFETTDVAADGNQCTLLKLSGAYTAETGIDAETTQETTDAEILEVVEPGLSQNEELLHESNKVNGILPTAVGPEKEEEKVFPLVDVNIETSNDAVMSTVIANESKILTESDDHAPDSIKNVGNNEAFETTDVAADRNQCTLLKLSGAYTAETRVDAETTKERETSISTEKECETLELTKKVSETSISTENQPLIAPSPRVQTSWIGCCGLFEVFIKSSR